MDTVLTLVIALGGIATGIATRIATGIGAIWTATLARRQLNLNEQRRFLHGQTEISRRQVQVTEENMREQNERAPQPRGGPALFRDVE